ncbi:hypothetical protein Srufu_070390 [Streptomyces libani subsp. rufus]|nr:hypothetical protein Srufu_070390 [Streptomyces libani subsp. rufus]
MRPLFSPHVGGIEDRTGQVDQVLLIQELENLLMQSAPDPGTRPDGEAAVHGDFDAPKHGGNARQAQPLTRT